MCQMSDVTDNWSYFPLPRPRAEGLHLAPRACTGQTRPACTRKRAPDSRAPMSGESMCARLRAQRASSYAEQIVWGSRARRQVQDLCAPASGEARAAIDAMRARLGHATLPGLGLVFALLREDSEVEAVVLHLLALGAAVVHSSVERAVAHA